MNISNTNRSRQYARRIRGDLYVDDALEGHEHEEVRDGDNDLICSKCGVRFEYGSRERAETARRQADSDQFWLMSSPFASLESLERDPPIGLLLVTGIVAVIVAVFLLG